MFTGDATDFPALFGAPSAGKVGCRKIPALVKLGHLSRSYTRAMKDEP